MDDDVRQIAGEVPVMLGDLIGAVGRGVADAQRALDAVAIEQIRALGLASDDMGRLAREFGYRPAWYRIPELDADISLSLTVQARTQSAARTTGVQLYATPVDATFSNRYEVTSDVATRVRFKVVPVPAPPDVDDLVVVPALTGSNYGDARQALDALGLVHQLASPADSPRIDAIGNVVAGDKVVETEPAAGEIVRTGSTVELTLNKPDADETPDDETPEDETPTDETPDDETPTDETPEDES